MGTALATICASLLMVAGACSCGGSPPARDGGALEGGPTGCVDLDGDGAGIGAECQADDCDDTDPLTTDECGSGCEERPHRKGCPCDAVALSACYHGPPDSQGQGACRSGIQQCDEGSWGSCEGQVFPEIETCDGLDEDCDGLPDDGVRGECGTCGDCSSACSGAREGCDPWTRGRVDKLVETESGALTLGSREAASGFVWKSVTGAPSVFKVDPSKRAVLAGYKTAPEGGHSLTYTTVDREGNVIAVSFSGSAVKVEAEESRCPDGNGNGVVDTSHGWDDVLAFPTADSWGDECIVWHTPIPESPQAVAVTEAVALDGIVERVWIGIQHEERFIELDASNGEPTGRELATPGLASSGAAVDGSENVWATFFGANLLGVFNPEHLSDGLETFPAPGGLALVAIDENDDVWASGSNVYRFDQAHEEFAPVFSQDELDTGTGYGTGHMTGDGEGNLWQAPVSEPWVYRIDLATLEWERYPLEWGLAFNVGVDFLQQLWIQVIPVENESPPVWVMDLESRELRRALDDCGDVCDGTSAGGDFTGLTGFLVHDELGIWTRLASACTADESVLWSAVRASAAVPPGSSIDLLVRTGADETELWQGPWLFAGALSDGESSVDLALLLREATESHHLLAIQARLAAGRQAAAPSLEWIEVRWGCEPPVR